MVATCSVKGAMARAAKNPKIMFSDVDLPSQNEIIKTILKSKSNAIETAVKIGLIAKSSKSKEESCFCPVKPCIPNEKDKFPHIVRNMSKDENFTLNDNKYKYLFANLSLKNYASKFENKLLDETSSYVEIPFVDCKNKFIVLKTSLCWLLSKGGNKLSSDRLLRVRQTTGITKSKTKKIRKVKLYCIK